MVEVHAGDSDDGVPEVVVIKSIQIPHHAIGRIGAGVAVKIAVVVAVDFLVDEITMFT